MAQKILVVDDEESLAQFVCRALRQQGYKTVCAYDGDNALSLVYEEMPDLVILDLMLPLMDGWEICRRVKSDEETRHIPILMLTARSSADKMATTLQSRDLVRLRLRKSWKEFLSTRLLNNVC